MEAEEPHLRVNLLGHCAICLNRMTDTSSSGGDDDDDGEVNVAGAASKRISLSSGMSTLHHLWPYLLGEGKAAEVKVKFVGDTGEDEDDVVTKLPPVCHLCGEELLELDRLHRELMKKIKDIKKIIKDTAGGGGVNICHCWRREGFGELLRNSHLESGMIRDTFQFLELLSGMAFEGIVKSDDSPLPARKYPDDDDDWKLKANVVVSLAKMDSQTCGVKHKMGPPVRKGKRPSESEEGLEQDSSSVYDDTPEMVKEEVKLEEEMVDADMLKDDDDDGDDYDEMKRVTSVNDLLADSAEDADNFEEAKVNVSKPKPTRRRGRDLLDSEMEAQVTTRSMKRRKKNRRRPLRRPVKKKSKPKPKTGTRKPIAETEATCEICKEKLALPHLYETHMGDLVLKCPNPECPYACSNPKTMVRNHFTLQRNRACKEAWKKLEGYTCDTCGFKEVALQIFRSHIRLHETATKNVTCPITGCEERFTVRQSVHAHIFQKHLAPATVQWCPLCKKCFQFKDMEGHLNEVHQVVEEVVKCQQCPFVLPNWESYLKHAFQHRFHGVPCYICKDGSKFRKNSDLRKHYSKEHDIGKPFICEQCGVECSSLNNLRDHIKGQHEGIKYKGKTFKCDLCEDVEETVFKTEILLVSHKIREHGAEPFACQVCQKTFHNICDLKTHDNRTHAAGRGFVVQPPKTEWACNVEGCSELFVTRKRLAHHKRKCHGILGPRMKRFICEFCSKEFFQLVGLNAHREIHLGIRHQCEVCGKDFSSNGNLRRHRMVHEGN